MPSLFYSVMACVIFLFSINVNADPIVNKNSNKCLGVNSASTVDGTSVSQYECSGESHQDWVEVPVTGGFLLQASHSGQCLDVYGRSTATGAGLIQWPCHGGDNQIFNWVGETLQVSHSNKCVAIESDSTASGAKVLQSDCNGSNAQKFSNAVVVNEFTMCSDASSSLSTGVLFDSGGSANRYSNNESCSFLIQPAANHQVTLSFSEFDYEEFFDYIYVYDGSNTNATLIGSFTSTNLPSSVTATSGAMYIVHSSDNSIRRDGFAASWSISPTLNVVAEWHFDESEWDGTSNEVLDNAGNMNGFAVNGANTVESGLVCNAASFDGVDDYITVSGIATHLNNTATLSFWMKTSQIGDNNYYQAPGITGIEEANKSSNDIFWGYLRGNGRLGFGKGGSNHLVTSRAVNNNTWQHIVMTRNEDSGDLVIYIDGVINKSGTGRTGGLDLSFSSIGRIEDTAGTPGFFAGQLDEVLIFGSVINADQVRNIYNNQLAGNNWDGSRRDCDTTLIAEWRLEEVSWSGQNDEVIDSSGNDYHGKLLYNASPSNTLPAISGSEGTCAYGSFSSGTVAFDNLPVNTASGEKTTVSFWMRWDGTNGSMPIGWSYYDLWFYNGSFGFNTWNNDIYGISSSGFENTWRHVTAEFTNGSAAVGSNRLWIDGVEQTLTQREGSPSNSYRSVGNLLNIGGAVNSTSYRFHGSIDEVRLYDNVLTSSQVVSIMNDTHPCGGNTLSYFSIGHDNSATYCLDETLSVTAYNSDAVVLTSYSDTITLDTQTGNGSWSLSSGNGSLVDGTVNDGIATYTFADSDNGTASFLLYYTEGNSSINVDVIDGSIRDDDTEGDLFFSATGFSVTASPLPNPPATPINDPIATQRSGQAFSISLTAYGLNPENADASNGECGIIESYSGNKNINFSTRYHNPLSGSLSASGSGSINFVEGQASISTQYNDVGEISIVVNDAVNGMSGDSNQFVVTPTDFSMAISDNPSTTSNGEGFIPAGDAFTVNVQALNAEGNPTPNYGNEQNPESVSLLLDSLVFPTGGNVGILSNSESFTRLSDNLFQNNALSWNEVGSIRLTAVVGDGDYLGTGNVTSAASSAVGRFYPESFFLGAADVSNSCTHFTYLSQPELGIAYTLNAINSAGDTVSNYDDGLGYPVGSIIYAAELDNNGINLASRLSVATTNWQAGEYNLIDTFAALARGTSLEAPLLNVLLGIAVDDIDDRTLNNLTMNASSSADCDITGSCNAGELGSASFYYGRVSLADAYGPETAALPVTFHTEYWTGQKFITHILDDCSVLPRSSISFNGNPIDSASDLSINLVGGITTGEFTSLSSSHVGFSGGDAGFSFSAPGAEITTDSFTVDVDLSSIDWLRFDWNQDGDNNNDTQLPTATMRFKSYRGHDRILYWRHQ